jgi:hypothetical protein
MHPVNSDSQNFVEEPRALAEAEGAADMTDAEAVIQAGGQAIEAEGNDLNRAASGSLQDVDLDNARQRMRDCQGALVSLGYPLGDHDDPADGISGMADPGTIEAVRQFQDDNDLDVTGVVDRDTYEGLLRGFEQAMGMRAHDELDDDFMPTHAGEAVQAMAEPADEGGEEAAMQDDLDELLDENDDEARAAAEDL